MSSQKECNPSSCPIIGRGESQLPDEVVCGAICSAATYLFAGEVVVEADVAQADNGSTTGTGQ